MRFKPGGRVARGWFALAMSVSVGAGLSACGGAAEPIVTEAASPGVVVSAGGSPVPSATPSTSATAAPLSDAELFAMMPDGADQQDLWGAMMTATFFLEQYAPMFHTGDTRVWEALSGQGCEYCADALANAERVRDEGWEVRGGQIDVDFPTMRGNFDGVAESVVSATADLAEGDLIGPNGDLEKATKGRRVDFALILKLRDGRWMVQEVVSRRA